MKSPNDASGLHPMSACARRGSERVRPSEEAQDACGTRTAIRICTPLRRRSWTRRRRLPHQRLLARWSEMSHGRRARRRLTVLIIGMTGTLPRRQGCTSSSWTTCDSSRPSRVFRNRRSASAATGAPEAEPRGHLVTRRGPGHLAHTRCFEVADASQLGRRYNRAVRSSDSSEVHARVRFDSVLHKPVDLAPSRSSSSKHRRAFASLGGGRPSASCV